MSLPAWNPEAGCPKCGCETVTVSYHKDAHAPCGCKDRPIRQPECCEWEHLRRTCQRCHFDWAEAVLMRAELRDLNTDLLEALEAVVGEWDSVWEHFSQSTLDRVHAAIARGVA